MSSESKGIVRITIQSTQEHFNRKITCLTLPVITDLIPSETFLRNAIEIPSNIKLADPEFHLPRPIDLLIGSGITLSILSFGQIDLSEDGHDLYLQKTRLGWVIAGSSPKQNMIKRASCCSISLESQLTKFWTIEEVTTNKCHSDEETDCEIHFINNVARNDEGRYIVRLPFRRFITHIGDSRTIAMKRLIGLEQRLNRDADLKLEYTRVFEEYKTLGHMSTVDNPRHVGYHMPHHAVIKQSSNTTKVRIVFDASAKSTNGISLNDCLMVGPTIQDKLFSHLIRFRTYNYILSADIEKMYRQILVHEDDRRFQSLLWRDHDSIKTYQLNTLTFGVSSSPFLAIRTIQKLADDESHLHPKAAEILKRHLYVDDLITGANSINEARNIRDEIISILLRGGFSIRQWASNDARIIYDLPNKTLHANYLLGDDHSLKTLGISWNLRDDKIYYFAHPIEFTGTISKRRILSEIAKIYDPLGLLGPVVLYAKQLMQDLWRNRVHWDESVPQCIHSKWSEFSQQFRSLDQLSFDRKILADGCHEWQIHGFCDASQAGYGACLYIRSVRQNKENICKLLCAKSRVSPIKTITIPRLELSGALLLARLFREVSSALNIMPVKVIFWCDSTIVLHWLNTPSHLLKTFVANRVVEIRELTGSHVWRHVRSEDNPADAISRGQVPTMFLKNKTWRSGPVWLAKSEEEWPDESISSMEIPELKRNTCLATTSVNLDIIEKYSSYTKACRIIAYCLRVRPTNTYIGPLSPKEINEEEIRVLKLLQASQFSSEFKGLRDKRSTYNGRLNNLNLFIDEDGLLRVGGRLHSSKLTFTQKHPILLPSRTTITDRIIREIHERCYHAGIQTTLYTLRQKFWLLDGRNQVRKIIRTCVRCLRFDSRTAEPKWEIYLPLAYAKRYRSPTPA